jgi:fibronectin type 3 domain-containing protein
VTISSISLTGTGFTISGASAPLTLNPNQNANLNIVFDPTTATSFTGQVVITSNSPSSSNIIIAITGVGVSHEVDLTWNAPTASTDPVAGYNVYRVISGGATYQQLNTSVLTQTSYADGAVVSGQTYTYIVKSVDATGVSSPPSNAFSALIP